MHPKVEIRTHVAIWHSLKNPLGRIHQPLERLVPESTPKFHSEIRPDTRTDFRPSSGWNYFRGASGLRIARNLSLNWMVFRYARNGATPDAKFRGTQTQKSKTCETRTKTNPTRERKHFYASNTSPRPLLTLY